MQKILESILGGISQDTRDNDEAPNLGLLQSLLSSDEAKRESEEAAERIWKRAIVDRTSADLLAQKQS